MQLLQVSPTEVVVAGSGSGTGRSFTLYQVLAENILDFTVLDLNKISKPDKNQVFL